LAHEAWAALPLIVNDHVLGGLGFSFPAAHSFDEDERQFMQGLADHCAQALKRAQLAEQAQDMAAFQVRQRLARDLHDAVSQVLFAATTIAEALPQQWERHPARALEGLQQIILLNRAAMAEMRMLLLELRPEAINKTHLHTLLSHLVDAAKGRKRIKVALNVEGEDQELPSEVRVALYRIAQESVNNILKHSRATQFTVNLSWQEKEVRLSIVDDGQGFDLAQRDGGLGLGMMRERAEDIGASLDIMSRPGEGTRITVLWQGPAA
jgi:two-component system nitrate/nitrite sensor histidine kinase NarX